MRSLHRWSGFTLAAVVAVALSGCAATPKVPAKEFAPVVDIPAEVPTVATGSIYNGGRNDNWFGRKRDYKVGDIITVLLNEQTQANRVNNKSASRESANNVLSALAPKLPIRGALQGLPLDGSEISSESTGTADQRASLTGSIAVTVTQVLSNGNLVVRGEKQLDLTEGSETIRVAGIIRSDDVAPNGTVLSRRLANAQISYTGTGELSNASKTPWATDMLLKAWPF
ncbi:MAG: Flagellar L-ring protein precursor [Pseudomonadota bacterium]|jgi:flagellar L-ring protein precursor FlgH